MVAKRWRAVLFAAALIALPVATQAQTTTVDDFTEYTYSVPAGPIGSFADFPVTRTFAQPIQSLKLYIVAGRADDIGYVGGTLVTSVVPSCSDVGTVTSVQEVTDQVTISGNTASFMLRAQENCCCVTGWGTATQGDRANARFHWVVTIGQPGCVPTSADSQLAAAETPEPTAVFGRFNPPRIAAAEQNASRAAELELALAAVQPHVEIDEHGFERLRAAEARRAGVPGEAIGLAMRVIALDNRIVDAAQRGEDAQIGRSDFEFIEPLFIQIAQADPCGTRQNPSPCPARAESNVYYFTRDDVVNALLGLGYHRTANYAGGSTGNDYSKVVSSTCGGSSFRSQAIIHQRAQCWTYNTQGPEPNPEVLGYVWPRLGWVGYVRWWHLHYC
jgi:hypothetical protein